MAHESQSSISELQDIDPDIHHLLDHALEIEQIEINRQFEFDELANEVEEEENPKALFYRRAYEALGLGHELEELAIKREQIEEKFRRFTD